MGVAHLQAILDLYVGTSAQFGYPCFSCQGLGSVVGHFGSSCGPCLELLVCRYCVAQ